MIMLTSKYTSSSLPVLCAVWPQFLLYWRPWFQLVLSLLVPARIHIPDQRQQELRGQQLRHQQRRLLAAMQLRVVR